MAIVLDSLSTSIHNTGTPPLTWTHTPVGTGNLVVVGLVATGEEDAVRVTSATYGALTLTDAGSSAQAPGSGVSTQFFYGLSPSSGAQTITINTDYPQSIISIGCCYLFSGAKTSSPVVPATGIGSTGSTPSITVATESGSIGLSLLGVDEQVSSTTATVGGGETQQFNLEAGFSTPYRYFEIGASSIQATGGDGVLNWTLGASKNYAISGIQIKAAPPPTMGGTFQLMFGR